jgi:SAM-dependent methyltransferase
LWLCGCEQIFTADLRDHFRPALLHSLIQSLDNEPYISLLQETLPDLQTERIYSESLKTVLDFISLIKSDHSDSYLPVSRILGDARHLPLADQSVDFVVSNNTLEHIPTEVIPGILRSFHRVLRPGGLMSHHIDMADHYSYFDSRISPWHFLRYSPGQWEWIENRLQSQNRLRVSHFHQMMEEAGFEIVRIDNEVFDTDHFRKQALHRTFAAMAPEEAGVLHTHIVTRRRD